MEILFKYKKRPKQDFINVMLAQLSTYHCVDGLVWNDELIAFTAERIGPKTGPGWYSLMAMNDGIVAGYSVGTYDKNKAYSFTYDKFTLLKQYESKDERAMYELLSLDFYTDQLPLSIYKKTKVTEKYSTMERAQAARFKLVDDQTETFPVATRLTHDQLPEIVYNEAEDFGVYPDWS